MLDINDYVSNGYANSLVLLNEKEKELGALSIDIGYSNTSIGLVYDNKYVFETSVPMGGETITKDISNILTLFVGLAVPSSLILIIIAIFDPALLHGALFDVYVVCLFVCIFAFVPLAYLFSCMFKRSGLASKLLFFLFIIGEDKSNTAKVRKVKRYFNF